MLRGSAVSGRSCSRMATVETTELESSPSFSSSTTSEGSSSSDCSFLSAAACSYGENQNHASDNDNRVSEDRFVCGYDVKKRLWRDNEDNDTPTRIISTSSSQTQQQQEFCRCGCAGYVEVIAPSTLNEGMGCCSVFLSEANYVALRYILVSTLYVVN